MSLATITAIILGVSGALLLGMAALIKTMVLGRLDDLHGMVSGLSKDMHRMDIRLTRLEAEHSVRMCPHHQEER